MTAIMPKLTEILCDLFDEYDGPIVEETTADDIPDWDSLAQVKLMVAVEAAFGIRFAAREVTEPANVGELAAMVEKKLSEKG